MITTPSDRVSEATRFTINQERLNGLPGKAAVDFGAVSHATLVAVGDKLGLYKAMAGAGPLTPDELARRTQITERYVSQWLNAQAAGGYVDYEPASGSYSLSPEQALLLADEDSPACVAAAGERPRLRRAAQTPFNLVFEARP
jgi:hypothetical protein